MGFITGVFGNGETIKLTFEDRFSKLELTHDLCCNDGGWILPDGTFYACPYKGGHSRVVRQLLLEYNDEELIAERKGWIKIQPDYCDTWNVFISKHPTQKQIDKLWDWVQAKPEDKTRPLAATQFIDKWSE